MQMSFFYFSLSKTMLLPYEMEQRGVCVGGEGPPAR